MDSDISVVIPAYNAGAFIDRALASIESQTLAPREVVVVNDGSSDDTQLRLEAFAKGSKLNLVITHQKNQGSAAARNNGIGLSSGKLIAFMDADDLMYPRFLERASDGLSRFSHWIACFSDRDVVDASGNLLAKDLDHPVFRQITKADMGDSFIELADDALFSMMVRGSVIPMTIVCRRTAVDAVGGFDETIRFHEDRLFVLELIKQGGAFGYVDEPLGIWQRHASNKTGTRNSVKGIESSDRILQKLLEARVRLELSPAEILDIHSARRELAHGWMYAASRARSATTFSVGYRSWKQGHISFVYFMRSIARYFGSSFQR